MHQIKPGFGRGPKPVTVSTICREIRDVQYGDILPQSCQKFAYVQQVCDLGSVHEENAQKLEV